MRKATIQFNTTRLTFEEAQFKRRKNIVDEILSTEKTYETNLNTIVQVLTITISEK